MDNLHAPTVPSGPASGPEQTDAHTQKLTLRELISKKDDLEAELKALGSVLDSHGVTMTTSLTTFDGYPRIDIDVPQGMVLSFFGLICTYTKPVRTTRARIVRLKNDYKELMKRIELGLHEHHAALNQQSAAHAAGQSQQETLRPGTSQLDPSTATPFARVNNVADSSPASVAGLRLGDQIRTFGSVNWTNHENLSKVAEVVQHSEGVSLALPAYFSDC